MEHNQISVQPQRNLKFILGGLLLSLALILLDQASKFLIRNFVESNGGHVEVLPFFNLVIVWNHGVSFGLMQAGSQMEVYLLIAVAAVITALFAYILFNSNRWFEALACAIIIGGAVGNIIDRILYGAVYDFLDFHAYGYHWPAFNVADSCVLIGIAMIAIDSLWLNPKSKEINE